MVQASRVGKEQGEIWHSARGILSSLDLGGFVLWVKIILLTFQNYSKTKGSNLACSGPFLVIHLWQLHRLAAHFCSSPLQRLSVRDG